MPRIRTIKPEFWQDEKLVRLPDVARLIFLGLVSLADDAGRLLDKPVKIEADLFDGETDRRADVVSALDSLASIGVIRRGLTASGQRIIEITNWKRHQRVDHPNLASAFPEIVTHQDVARSRERFASNSREPRESLAHHTNDQRPVPTTSTNENDQSSSEYGSREPLTDDDERRVFACVHQSGHDALRALLAAVPHPPTWARAIVGMASGLSSPSGSAIGAEKLAVGIVDFVAAGKHLRNPSAGLFRGFVKSARAPIRQYAGQQTEAEYRAELLATIRRQNIRRRSKGDPEKPLPEWAAEIDAMFPDGRTFPLHAA